MWPSEPVGDHTAATSPRKPEVSTCRSILVSEAARPGRCTNASTKQPAARLSGTSFSRVPSRTAVRVVSARMGSPNTCQICGGPIALLHTGAGLEAKAEAFSPTNHQPGQYGDLYKCARCGTV